MFRRLLLIPLLLALVACQGPQVQRDFDPTRDFSAYRAWSWKEPALQYRPDDPRIQSDLTEQRIRDAIAEQLDQRGLRPATASAAAGVQVQAWYIVDQRTQQYTTTSGLGQPLVWLLGRTDVHRYPHHRLSGRHLADRSV